MTSNRVRSVSRVLGALLCVAGAQAAASGCYSYRTIPVTGVAPGSTVRAQLSVEGRVRLEEYFPQAPRAIVGEVVDADNGSLVLLTRIDNASVPSASGLPLQQRILVQHQEIAGLEERGLDRGRTFGLTSALAAGSALIVWHFLTGGGRGGVEIEPPPDPVTSVIRIPLPGFLGGGAP